ncbi:MAG: hypothetical protein KAQ64_04720 [Candidatus Pacebacteria bacterium]|nr:hypothetical protein [Candidatus Paceibacterota bacterium]
MTILKSYVIKKLGSDFLKGKVKYKSFIERFRTMFSSISDNFVKNKRTRIKDKAEEILRFTPKEMRNKKAIVNALWEATKDIYHQDNVALKISKDRIKKLVENHFK